MNTFKLTSDSATNLTSSAELPQLNADDEFHKKSQYLQSLYDIIVALNAGATFEEITNSLLEKLIELSNEEHVYITIINVENNHLKYVAGSGLYKNSIGFSQNLQQGINGEAWKKASPIYIPDYQSYENRLPDKEFQSIRSVVVLPLITKDKIIGTVGFAAEHIRPFENISTDLLNNFVQLASTTLENAQLKSKLRKKHSQFETLYKISLNSIDRLDTSKIYNSLINEFINVIDFGQAYLCLVESEHSEHSVLRIVADTLNSTSIGKTIAYGEGLAGRVWASQEALFIEDYESYSGKSNLAPIKVKSLACIPLKNGDNIIGILGIASEDSFKFDNDFKFTLQAFADIASIAVINSQAFQALALKTKESELLERTQQAITNKLDLTELCQSFTNSITTIFNYSGAVIIKVEDNEFLQLSSSGDSISINNQLITTLLESKEAQLLIENKNTPENNTRNTTESYEDIQLSHLVSPLTLNGQFFGFLYIIEKSDKLTLQDKNIMQKCCKQLEGALESAELHGRIKKDLIRTQAFYKVSKTIQTHRNLEDIASEIIKICREALSARWAVLYRVDQHQKKVTAHARSQILGETPLKILQYDSLMNSFTGWVMNHQDSILTDSLINNSKGHQETKSLVNDIGSAIIVPLVYQEKSLGSLGFVNKNSDKNFTHGDLELAENVANQAAVAIVQHELSHQLEHQAYHDALTTLPNRAFFEEKLEHTIETVTKENLMMAVLFLDLDGFKHVNDTLGHDIGDTLLKIVAQRLKTKTRKTDTIARLGGDEFGIIISEFHATKDVFSIARTILSCFKEPFSIKGHRLQISTSIGISLFPEDGKDAQTLLKYSDSAMYAAKSSGKNNIRRFIPAFATTAKKRLEIEIDLNRAIQQKEFTLYYQPKLSLETGKWLGAEALIRWIHPEKGFISPGDFIPIAEESNLIIDISNWVLHETCRQAVAWHSKNHPALRIAINISALHFEHPNFISTIKETLEEHQLHASVLELEVTESVVMKDMDLVIQRLKQLKSMGITIAIDDFGTGYSSLQYLNKLPLDTLKIDKSFIDEIGKESHSPIVTGILNLAQSFGLETVAEGVETKKQVEILKSLGCSQVQGFYFGRPMPAESFWNHYYKTTTLSHEI